MNPVRTAARAVILQDEGLLTIKMKDNRGVFYILPGGGPQPGETLAAALKRECMEELGAEVRILGFVYIREYIGKHHHFARVHSAFHQLEVVFRCELANPIRRGAGSELDKKQIGWEWLRIDSLHALPFYPRAILPYFRDGGFFPPAPYLGDIN